MQRIRQKADLIRDITHAGNFIDFLMSSYILELGHGTKGKRVTPQHVPVFIREKIRRRPLIPVLNVVANEGQDSYHVTGVESIHDNDYFFLIFLLLTG